MQKYEVVCKCGHVRQSNYIVKSFPIMANDGKEAAEIGRNKGRVKHDHKDAILNVIKIDEERYRELIWLNRKDPYFHCRNKQEQNLYDLSDQIVEEKEKEVFRNKKGNIKPFHQGKVNVRNPRKYNKNVFFCDYEEEIDIW